MSISLNDNELAVFRAIEAAAEAHTGGDFCDYEDVNVAGVTANQLRGYITQLVHKHVIVLYDMGDYTQIQIPLPVPRE